MPRRRLNRQEQQADTRERVLRAAATVFARRGFHGASVDQVAEEAGFTKGAVYSNFRSKDDLFVALLDARCRDALAETRRILEAPGSANERIQHVGDQLVQRLLRDRDWMPLFIEFWAASARDAELRRRFAAIWDEMRNGVARLIAERARRDAVALPLPPDQLAAAAMALHDGLALQMLVDPDAINPRTVGASLSLLMAPLSQDAPVPEEASPADERDAVDPGEGKRNQPVGRIQRGGS